MPKEATTEKNKKTFKFSSLFVKETENTEEKNNANEQNVSTENVVNIQPVQNTVLSAGTIVPSIKADLEKVLNDHNFPGEDYLELREAVAGMSKSGIDNNTSLKAAFAILTSRGLTKEKAITTAKKYIEILQEEKKQFDISVQKQIEKKITTPEQEIVNLSTENLTITKQIEELTAKINKNNETSLQKKQDIAQANVSIENTKKNYETTFAQCVKEIEDDITKIETLIA